VNLTELSKSRFEPGLLHVLIDELATDYAEGEFVKEIAVAREYYFTQSGNVFEDDNEVFEMRSLAFVEWYVIERSVLGGPAPVIRRLQQSLASKTIDLARLEGLAFLANSHRSLFDIVDVDAEAIELEDVLGGARFQVTERRSTVGFEIGSIMEARIAWDGVRPVFTKTFLFHPKDARGAILDHIDSSLLRGGKREEIMFQLAQLYLRWHRQGHLNAARIYQNTGIAVSPVPL
jgi:hypothetical protein